MLKKNFEVTENGELERNSIEFAVHALREELNSRIAKGSNFKVYVSRSFIRLDPLRQYPNEEKSILDRTE